MNKKDSYWFRHDSTAGRALKMRKMSHIYGHWGKGIYWDVVEILRDQENYEFECDESSLQMLADLIGCKDDSKFINWYNDSIRFELLKEENSRFYSPALSEVMKRWDSSKSNGSKGGRPKKNLDETQPITQTKPKRNLTHNLDETIIEQYSIEQNKDKIDWSKLLVKFNDITGKASRVVPDKAKKQILARIKEGYTKTDIIKGIEGCYKDSYHKETNHKYLTLEFISRPDKLEKFVSVTPLAQKKAPQYKDDWR